MNSSIGFETLKIADDLFIQSIDPTNCIVNENNIHNTKCKSANKSATLHQTTSPRATKTTDGWGGSINSRGKNTFRIYFQNVNSIQVIDEMG